MPTHLDTLLNLEVLVMQIHTSHSCHLALNALGRKLFREELTRQGDMPSGVI